MFESPWHWAVVAIVAFILFFGWKQLPEMSRSLGRSLRIFKTEIKGMSEDDKAREAAQAAPPAIAAAPVEPVRAEVVKKSPRPSPSPNARPVGPADRSESPAGGA